MNKILFLDRDGVINYDPADGSFCFKPEEFIILDEVIPVLKTAMEKGYKLVVITNQSGIGRGLYTHEDVNKVHRKLVSELEQHHISLLEIYYCPHHPDSSQCLCRKPKSILIEKALARFSVNANKCIMVGDRERDIKAANDAGISKTILITTNSSLTQVLPLL